MAHMVGVITMEPVETPVWFEITGMLEVDFESLFCVGLAFTCRSLDSNKCLCQLKILYQTKMMKSSN